MSELIQKWIANCTGIVMKMDPATFVADVMDGTILARILHSYNIITQNQSISIIPTDNPNVAFRNLMKIGLWLKAHKIMCTEDELLDISLGKSSVAIKFFYQLYLALHDKDNLHFIAYARGNERLHPNDTCFQVDPVQETFEDNVDGSPNRLSKPLMQRKDIIEWNQNRYQTILENCEDMRQKYATYIRDKYSVNYRDKFPRVTFGYYNDEKVNALDERFPNLEECSYEELKIQEENAAELKQFEPDQKAAKKAINILKQKRRTKMKQDETYLHQQKMLLMDLWKKLLTDQEKEFNDMISNKMLKQSEFEKQMFTKMLEVRHQKQNMMENRKSIDKEVNKKREAEFLEKLFIREREVGDPKYNYYFERNRAIELHRRLYAEELRLKNERHTNICKDIVKDFVNIAIKHSEFKERFNIEAPKSQQKEWANLFVKEQPIFGFLEDVHTLVENNEDLPEELEEIHRMESYRQDELDQRDFENYLNFEWPWELEELHIDHNENLINIEHGLNVLGYAVHRVLLAKYPKPNPPPKPNLPKTQIAVCMNGLTDNTVLPVLQKFLLNQGVRIIEIQEAINFSLEMYFKEIQTEHIDDHLTKKSEAAVHSLKKGKKKAVKDSKKGKKGEKKGNNVKPLQEDPHADKECQTPIKYPCEEIILSFTGELGKTAFDLLNTGEELTDNLIAVIFVEYLKSLVAIDGWVLVNFPCDIKQAALLEEALTGTKVPGISDRFVIYSSKSIGDVADLQYRESCLEAEELNSVLRLSKILPNPQPVCDEFIYKTYLTAYINLQLKTAEENTDVSSQVTNFCSEENQIVSLEEFYTDQGCNYSFYYKTFDFATTKHLAKLIIGDYSLPRKTSVELLGDTILYAEASFGKGFVPSSKRSKATKTKKSKKEVNKKSVDENIVKSTPDTPSKETKKSKSKGNKKSEDKNTVKSGKGKQSKDTKTKKSKSEVNKESVDENIVKSTTDIPNVQIIEEQPPEPNPGERLWKYTDLSFPNDLQINIASFWENIENIYISDFRELFFIKRIIINAIVPYLTFVRQHMEIFIDRPDDKQNYLREFQTIYNEIDADLRNDIELKAEVHCRIAEFREKLLEICDRRMTESEEERKRFINENWLVVQISELTNIYVTAMQLEIDRACDTFQFLVDYYYGEITQMPSEEPRLVKTILNKVELNRNNSIALFGRNVETIISEMLTTLYSEKIETPFHDKLLSIAETSMQALSKWKIATMQVASRLESIFGPVTGKKGRTSQPGTGKKEKASRPATAKEKISQSGSKKGKSGSKLLTFFEPDAVLKLEGPRAIYEWICAIDGEFFRAKLRIEILSRRGLLDIDELLNYSKRVFYDLYNDVYNRYHKEVDNINVACEVLAGAVEAEMPLQAELVLDGDKFYIDPCTLLFEDPLPMPEQLPKEKQLPGVFTIEQLEDLKTILIDLAPNGSIPERTFIYLLQDVIIQQAEDEKDLMVPMLWKKLQPNLIARLSFEIFGNVEFVDWRDFIIYNFNIEFPSEEDLLLTRQQFRECDPDLTETVKDYQFYTIKLWFENSLNKDDPQEVVRSKLIKELIFKLYRIDNDTINYTALLLAFCKDDDLAKGFGKALTLALGKCVCWDTVIGNTYIESIMEQRFIEEQIRLKELKDYDEAVTDVKSVLTSVIDRTVHVCDSVVIEDVIEEFEDAKTYSLVKEVDTSLSANVCNITGENVEELFTSTAEISNTESELHEELSMEEKFSNIEIGFQPAYNQSKIYMISFEALLTVLTASLPWHARAQTINDESLRQKLHTVYMRLLDMHSNSVYTHEIINDPSFKELVSNSSRFLIKYPGVIVENLVNESSGNCCVNI